MRTHSICFYEEINKIIPLLSSSIIKYAPYLFFCTIYNSLMVVGINHVVSLIVKILQIHCCFLIRFELFTFVQLLQNLLTFFKQKVAIKSILLYTVLILSFWTDRSGQTVQTQIKLLLEEQFDLGLHCLLFHLHLFDKIP